MSKDDKLEVTQISYCQWLQFFSVFYLVKILAKEFPELFELLGDCKERLSEVITLHPLLKTAWSHVSVLSPKVTMAMLCGGDDSTVVTVS